MDTEARRKSALSKYGASQPPLNHMHPLPTECLLTPVPTLLRVDVNQYLFIFLKFVSSVIPTIEYDYTLSG
jgi:hypothetical protein